ncbi:uncharacterized protein MEPE_00169 [Melanopsichium pennsylvanicum]|uniref:Uncharacterized protein n=2 Tax=Melanopsichium pennsylvanicum TaxID=63383 RepID=A0AAJ5C2I7_9BASI|nr:uncharacterized protein MEPE_00169 [Melanopsichium pennsylvanicum]
MPLSDESARGAPRFLHEMWGTAGPSRSQSRRPRFDNLSQAYAIAQSCEHIASMEDHHGYESLAVIGRRSEVVRDIISSSVTRALSSSQGIKGNVLLIATRQAARGRGLADKLVDVLGRFCDRPPDAWVVPVSMDELDSPETLPRWIAGSAFLLPVCTGSETSWLCAVGTERTINPTPPGVAERHAKVQWYDQFVRPGRMHPDICYDCAMIRYYALSRLSQVASQEIVKQVLA